MAFVGLVLGGLVLSGCGVFGNGDEDGEASEDTGRIAGDQDLFDALNDGMETDPALFELRDLTCVQESDRLAVSVVVVNRAEIAWSFDPEFTTETLDGEVLTKKPIPGFLQPGEEGTVSTWFGGTDFPDEPRCDVAVFNGVEMALQDDEYLEQLYEILEWER